MTKKVTFWITWYALGVVLIGFYVVSAPHLAHVVATTMPKINPYLNVVVLDLVGAFGMLYCPLLWEHMYSKALQLSLAVCVPVLVLGTVYFNILAWR